MRPLFLSLLLSSSVAACGTPLPPPASDAGVVTPDASSEVDAATTIDAGPERIDAGPPAPICPPAGPTGMGAGDLSPDLTLTDCDGVEHTLYDLCERQAVWLFEFADWCPPCRSFANTDANRIYDRFAGPDFEGWMVISEDSGFDGADAADCAEIRDRYGIHMPVLFDTSGALQSAFGVASNEIHIVLSEGMSIEWVGHYAGDQVESRIEGVLTP